MSDSEECFQNGEKYVQNKDGTLVLVMPVADAADRLGISRGHLNRLGRSGKHFRTLSEDGSWLYEVPSGVESAGARTRLSGGHTGGFAYLYDDRNKSPRYLIRNGTDGAVVNQMASRIHAVAYALGSAPDLSDELQRRGVGPSGRARKVYDGPSENGVPCLLHISTRDVHVGEPGDPRDYADEIEDRVRRTLEWVRVAHGHIDEVVLTLGSDWLTVDNYFRTTTRGTNIPSAGSVYEIMRWAEELAIRVIDLCREYSGRVVGICEQGNHDAVLGAAMARTCRAWYRDCEDVEVVIPECGGVRTYHMWEDVLLASHHGHVRKPSQLPAIIAAEEPRLWGAASHRYILLGHRHHSQRWAMGDLGGCEVIQTRSPSPQNEYEHRLGFVDDIETLESFVFQQGRGLVTHRRA